MYRDNLVKVNIDGTDYYITESIYKDIVDCDNNVKLQYKSCKLVKQSLEELDLGIEELLSTDKANWVNIKMAYGDRIKIFKCILGIIINLTGADYESMFKVHKVIDSLIDTYNKLKVQEVTSAMDIHNKIKESGVHNIKALNNYLSALYRSDKLIYGVVEYLSASVDLIYKGLLDRLQYVK